VIEENEAAEEAALVRQSAGRRRVRKVLSATGLSSSAFALVAMGVILPGGGRLHHTQ
jgi:hypothetical protein